MSGAAAMTSPTKALAQSGAREVLIGISKVGRSAIDPAANVEAALAYEKAAAVLNNGSTAAAQRLFEQLISRYPESPAADRARSELAALYVVGATPRLQSSLPASGGSYLGGGSIAAESFGPTSAGPPWRTQLLPARKTFHRTVQDDFRSSVGDLVFFSEGQAELGSRARKVLSAQADWLKRHPDRAVLVEGHSDEPAGGKDSVVISSERANVVRRRLIDEGIAANRITVIAHGATKRIAVCTDDGCASQNRRVTTTILGNSMAENVAR